MPAARKPNGPDSGVGRSDCYRILAKRPLAVHPGPIWCQVLIHRESDRNPLRSTLEWLEPHRNLPRYVATGENLIGPVTPWPRISTLTA